MAASTSVVPAKAALRKEMKAKIKALGQEEKAQQSRSVTERLLADPCYTNAKTLSIYLHMDDEIRTLDILKAALAAGKRCYVPRYFMNGNQMDMLLLNDLKDYENLPETKWKIKQPADDEVRPEALDDVDGLDLMLIPGMAFTEDGKRLGRGKGYYDTYLAKAKAKMQDSRPKTVALAFKEQILPDIPVSHHDYTLDRVLHPDDF